jgi:hypothetical protein
MDVCDSCGRIRKQGATFCNGCGSRFPDDDAPARPVSPSGPPGSAGPSGPAGSGEPVEAYPRTGPYRPADPYGSPEPHRPPDAYQPGPSRRSRRSGTRFIGLTFPAAVVAIVVVVFAAAAAAGGVLLFTRHHASHGQAALSSSQSTRTTPPAQASSAADPGSSAPPQSPSATSPSPSSSGVTVGAGASQDPDASSVAAFLGQYFAAINGRDYQSYLALLSPQLQQAMTQAEFDSGYRSTVDSSETLVGISTASDGDLAAEVTFTSHQNPADSPDHSESCTNWDISLFLAQGGSGYVSDPAPPGYHASHQACS